jgi:hypothetical protein
MLNHRRWLGMVFGVLLSGAGASPLPFFGQHLFYLPSFQLLPSHAFDGLRLWNSSGTEWRDVEPARGQYDFRRMDGFVAAGGARQLDLLYTLGQTPRWASARPDENGNSGLGAAAEPRDMNDWSDYVRTVVARYRGKIATYEMQNEPRIPEAVAPWSPGFFSGSTASLIEMTRRAHAVLSQLDPGAKLVCPAMDGQEQGVKRLQYFLAHGGGQYCEVIGFHFYLKTQSLAEFQDLLAQVRQVMAQNGQGGKPLWDTETGMQVAQSGYNLMPVANGPRGPVYDDRDAGRSMVKLLLAAMSGGVARTYWFAYDSSSMGSTLANKKQGKLNVLGQDYQQLHAWLSQVTLGACTVSDAQGDCRIQRHGHPYGRIVWGLPYRRSALLQERVRQIGLLDSRYLNVRSLSDDPALAQLSHQFRDPMLLLYGNQGQ